MNWTQIEGKWEQAKAEARIRWGELTEDDLHVVGGQLDRLIGKVVERYGVKREQARKEIEYWAEGVLARFDALGKTGGNPQTSRRERDRVRR